VIVPEALVPVHCDAEHDHAVYVEPNVWVEHALSDARPDQAESDRTCSAQSRVRR